MTRKIHLFFVLAMLFLVSASSFAKTVTINIKDFQFEPGSQTIDLGDIVKWTNQGPAPHTSTSDINLWDSKNLSPGATFSRTFTTEGTFNYHCTIHPFMTGKIIVRSAEATRINIGKAIVTATPKVLPIKLNLSGKNTDKVYLGSYIVNAQGSCADCHSCPTYAAGHNPFKGETKQFSANRYLAGGVAFGPIISANLTPDSSGKPAGMTLAQFKEVLRTGRDHENPADILQVMPWPIVGMMSDRDLEAVYTYLRSIPSLQAPATTCSNPGQ